VELFYILASFACVTAAYVHVSVRDGSYVNVLTPAFAFLVPVAYLLESYHLWLFGPSASPFAYAMIYACYAATFGAFALGYSRTSAPAFRLPFTPAQRSGTRLTPYLVLAAAIALYSPVLYEFKSTLANPRQIYEQTRTGYGVYFFLSTTLCYLALTLFLFRRRIRKLELALFTIICLVFLWLHGSKNQMLVVIFILATYSVYVRRSRISLFRFAIFGTFLAVVALGLFLLTSPYIVLGGRGLEGIAGYSDYTRNGMLVIDSDVAPLYGRLTLEQEFYSRVPRPLFPDKPNDFGALYLAEHFYPEKFLNNQGAPAFSFGPALADFGVLALPLLLVANLLAGVLLKIFMTGLRRYGDPGNFTLVLFVCGLPLIPIAGAFLLPETFMLAVVANILHRIRASPRRVEKSV